MEASDHQKIKLSATKKGQKDPFLTICLFTRAHAQLIRGQSQGNLRNCIRYCLLMFAGSPRLMGPPAPWEFSFLHHKAFRLMKPMIK